MTIALDSSNFCNVCSEVEGKISRELTSLVNFLLRYTELVSGTRSGQNVISICKLCCQPVETTSCSDRNVWLAWPRSGLDKDVLNFSVELAKLLLRSPPAPFARTQLESFACIPLLAS